MIASNPSKGTGRRLRALIIKETHQMLRDPSTLLMGIFVPIMMMLLFGYGLSLDVKDVPIAIVIEQPSPEANEIAAGFTLSPYFTPRFINTMQEADRLMLDRKIDGIIHLAGDFSRNVNMGDGSVQIIVHGTDANRARAIQVYAQGALTMWTQRRIEKGLSVSTGQVVVENRLWYNESNNSHHFLVPGLIVLIITIIGTLLTAMVVAREWERGTFESLFVTPVRSWEILIAKTVPYFCLGMVGLILCLLAAQILFGVPLRGSIIILTLGSMIYLIQALGMGLVISAVTRNQFLASQLALLLTALPSTLLSGFIFDLKSMPVAIESITRILPARYYVTFIKTMFLTGNVPYIIFKTTGILALMAVILISLAQSKTKKRLG